MRWQFKEHNSPARGRFTVHRPQGPRHFKGELALQSAWSFRRHRCFRSILCLDGFEIEIRGIFILHWATLIM